MRGSGYADSSWMYGHFSEVSGRRGGAGGDGGGSKSGCSNEPTAASAGFASASVTSIASDLTASSVGAAKHVGQSGLASWRKGATAIRRSGAACPVQREYRR